MPYCIHWPSSITAANMHGSGLDRRNGRIVLPICTGSDGGAAAVTLGGFRLLDFADQFLLEVIQC